jgi:hypothetical protein
MFIPTEIWQIVVGNLSFSRQISLTQTRNLYNKTYIQKLVLHTEAIPKIKSILGLRNLDIYDNGKITDLNHLQKLKKVDISCDCGVNQKGIEFLDQVEEMSCWNNDKITDLNHLRKLRKVDISYDCGVNQKGIKSLRLVEEIDHRGNSKITNLGHLQKLKKVNNRIVNLQ